MSFDLEKLQAVAELGEVIRLQNEALERLVAFRKARPYMMMPNLAKMVEENLKENVQVLYKELNNLHKPPAQQTRYICKECQMAFVVALPGGICDECRARRGSSQPRAYVPHVEQPGEEIETDETQALAVEENMTEVSPDKQDEFSDSGQPTNDDDISKAYASALASDDGSDMTMHAKNNENAPVPDEDTEIALTANEANEDESRTADESTETTEPDPSKDEDTRNNTI